MTSKYKRKELLRNSEHDYLKSAVLLDSLGQEPITINRAFVDLTGNVLSALWLTYALQRQRCTETEEYIEVLMSASECTKDTGITRAQQQTCRKSLIALGLLNEQTGGQGKIIRFRISTRRLIELLAQQAMPLARALQRADKAITAD